MTRSHDLFQSACRHIPGGVNSPVRAFKGVGGDPVFFARGEGAWLFDVDDKRYIDYVASWGPMIAGHAHPDVVKAVREMAAQGLGFGAPTEIETRMAEKLGAVHGPGAHGQFGHRGDHERHPPGPRVYRA